MINDADTPDSKIENFEANPKLKKVGQKIPMSKAQIIEFTKCADNPIYFIENYVKIITIDEGVIPFQLRNYQKKMVKAFHNNNRVIVRAARQSGKTDTSAAYMLWHALFNGNKRTAILANKETIATEILSRIQQMYMEIPLWLQQGILEWNKRSFLLENNASIISAATSSNAIRGFTISLLFLDEFAHVPNHVALDFFSSVYPTISSGKKAKLIICSTPRGMNAFYKLFNDAENAKVTKSSFIPITVTWDQVPGRNKKWAEDQKRTLGEERFDQEQNVAFLGSAGTLINGKALARLSIAEPIESLLDHKLAIFERPLEGHRYILTADCSHGKELDASAFCITDVTEMPYRVVAKFRCNEISPMLYPNVIAQTAKLYNEAYVLVENNDIGALVLKILIDDLDYENIIYTDSYLPYKDTQVTGKNLKSPGLKTTSKTKRQGCLALKNIIEGEQMLIQDFEIISELTTFIIKPNKTYAADEGANDDLVMSLVLFAWLTTQQFFKDLANSDIKKQLYENRERLIEEEMPLPPMLVTAQVGPNQFRHGGVIWQEVGDEDSIENTDNNWTGYSSRGWR